MMREEQARPARRGGRTGPGADEGTAGTERKQAEAERDEALSLLQTVVNAAPVRIFWKDRESRYLGCNPLFARDAGKSSPEELIGKGDQDMVWAGQAALYRADDKLVMETGAARLSYEEPQTTPDGRKIWLRTSKVALHDRRGETIGVLGIYDDITEQKRAADALRESEERFRAVFNGVSDGIVLLDLEAGQYVMANKAMCAMLGTTEDEIRALPPDKIHPAAAGSERGGPGEEAAKSAVSAAREVLLTRRDGSELYADINTSTLLLGDRMHLVSVFRDVTERRAQEREIQRMNAVLEQRVAERTAELGATNKELEAFAYSVSHDLRTPLRAIDGFSQIIVEDYADKLDAAGREFLQEIRAASQRMGHLIDDLLQLSRLTRAEMKRQEVDLSATARAVLSDLRRLDPGRQVEIAIDDGLTANGDPRLLQAVLANLLGNAWKFTGKTPQPRIEMGRREEGGRSVFFVRDNGAGFNMKYAHKLFGAFQRLHDTTEFEGTGVGLATVQRVIHRHGGRVWAEGQVDRGATFYFTV